MLVRVQSWAHAGNTLQKRITGTKTRPKLVQMLGTTYRRAKLANRNGDLTKEWYVYYSVRSPETGKMQRFRIKGELNRLNTKGERREYAAELIKSINHYLSEGWTPFGGLPENPETQLLSIKEVFTKGLEIKQNTLAAKSYLDYTSSIKMMLKYLQKKNLIIWPSDQLRKHHAQQFIDEQLQAGMSTTRVREIVQVAKSVWNAVADRDLITNRPFEKLILPKRIRGTKNIPLSKDEMRRVSEHLQLEHPELLLFCRFIYGSAIRPKELLLIRREDIDFEQGTITVHSTVAKNKKTETVDIPDTLLDQLTAAGMKELPADHLLFGRQLKPGKYTWHRNRVSDLWAQLVRKQLGIDKDMYALKHRGALDLLDEGVDVKRIQLHLRHSSLEITDKYLASMAGHRITEVKKRKMGL